MAMKNPDEVVDMLSELQKTLRDEQGEMDERELIYMAGLLRTLRYVLGLEDTLSNSWRQGRIPTPPSDPKGTD